jgi:pimeloyl-ACP methyl ester carboxylesterase
MAYRFERVASVAYGEGENAYWIIEPRDTWDKPLPVVLFVHGLGLTNFSAYRTWINHLVAKGNIVIYPAYHTGGIVDPTTFTDNTAKAAAQALARCDGKQRKLADTKRFTMIGHSLGGTIIANLAARPEHYKLPAPGALMLLQPGDTKSDKGLGALFPSITEDHATIPKGTLMLVVDCEGDYFVSPKAGERLYDNAKSIGAKDKRRLLLRTDDYAEPAIIADHMLPMAWTYDQKSKGRVNAYDFALWRWFDALQATAHGEDQQREHVFGEAALDLGKWSDGTPVRPPIDVEAVKLEP